MKRIISAALVCVMLISALCISVGAAEPFGTVLEIPHSDKAPSMDNALPDESWGKALAHVDKNTANAGITQYKKSGTVKQDLSFDVYGVWTDDTIYLCFTSPDKDLRGKKNFWHGDGIQMIIYPGIIDISARNTVATGWKSDNEYEPWDWCVTLGEDLSVPTSSDVAVDQCAVFGDEATGTLVVKLAMPALYLGYKRGETYKENDLFSFDMIRIDGSDEDTAEAYVGWLEWGNFFDTTKMWDPDTRDTKINNTKTTTANTIKLVKSGAAPAEQPSDWAKAEVDKAIAAGLVPDTLQQNYTKGISRENLSKILSKLLDKVYGKEPLVNTAEFTDTTDADVLKAANLEIIKGYKQNDGTYQFKPENTLKRCEMAAIINRVANLCGETVTGYDSEVVFKDTTNHWCKSELGWPVHTGIIKGTSATQFSPENTLTTEQTIMMIYRAYEALKK